MLSMEVPLGERRPPRPLQPTPGTSRGPSFDLDVFQNNSCSRPSNLLSEEDSQINLTADYAQEDGQSEAEHESGALLSLSHSASAQHNIALASLALLKSRSSQGPGNGRRLSATESLKSKLHLDGYSFFGDADVGEAQLQVTVPPCSGGTGRCINTYPYSPLW